MRAGLIFPHQLFENTPINEVEIIYLIEEQLFFNQYSFHKRKIALHRASMQFYKDYLINKGFQVEYISAQTSGSDVRVLIENLGKQGVDELHTIDPADDWLSQRIKASAHKQALSLIEYENPLFLNSTKDLKSFFKPHKKKLFQTSFYKDQRKKRNILLDQNSQPKGGKWTYDKENRKKYPKAKIPPTVHWPSFGSYQKEALTYVKKYYKDNLGVLDSDFNYPVTFEEAKTWFKQFLEYRFSEFGPYEDAIVSHEYILNHAVLTPMLNVGLLRPEWVLNHALTYAEANQIPIQTIEGFVRQIVGWREFIRAVYHSHGRFERTRNFWNFKKDIPQAFYTANTGIPPVDQTIKKVLKSGYCHHIERLMIIGNFMLLCEIHPDAVYKWFMELFVDAYDWVMVPNVYGMSQFADGGLMSTKPYISSSNYILKMSNYKKGEWCEVWDALFWRFMIVHRDFFEINPRMGMLIRNFEKKEESTKKHILNQGEQFVDQIHQSSF